MNKNGVEQVVLSPCWRWKCERHWICGEIQLDEVLHYVVTRPTRFAGLVAYNPHAIKESLEQVTRAITVLDCRGAYVHTSGSDVKVTDRRMYPLYAKCVELNIPVLIQVGAGTGIDAPAAIADLAPVLVDYPELQVIAAWSGHIHCAELSALLERYPHVSVAMDANVSPAEEPELVALISGHAERCMWGSNGLPWNTLLKRVRSLQLPPGILSQFLHDNAFRAFSLARPLQPAVPPEERIPIAE